MFESQNVAKPRALPVEETKASTETRVKTRTAAGAGE
ncbi:hypothetical protein EMGBD4_16120 [Verrucomicrobiota bacterium]|nr:hypothetical protein EMGBD4_16120 [Verrucomicrobiota bacterium]